MTKRQVFRTIEAVSVVTFILHALRVAFSVEFGIIYDQIFEGPMSSWLVVSVLLLLAAVSAPLLLSAFLGRHSLDELPAPGSDRTPQRRWLAIYAIVAALARVAVTINDPLTRYWGSLMVLAAGGLYFAILLVTARRGALVALPTALLIDMLLRNLGHTYDLSLRGWWLPVQGGWALLVIGSALWLNEHDVTEDPPAGLNLIGGLGIGAWLFLETSLLAFPNGIARWSNTSMLVAAPALIVLTALPLLPAVYEALWDLGQRYRQRWLVTLMLPAMLLVGSFTSGPLSLAALLLAHASALAMLPYILDNAPPDHRPTGSMLALGLLLLVVLNFANAFTFTYPYTLPVMRGMGWLVYLVAALLTVVGANTPAPPAGELSTPVTYTVPVIIGGLGVLVATLIAVWPRPVAPLPEESRIRAGTYNIHYGYDDDWHLTLEDIARTIEDSGADVIALQEVDTGRMTSYMTDNAYYLARRLHMNVVYLPTVEHLTGIALLYKGDALATDMAYVTSLQEQTGVVYARLDTSPEPLHAFGMWMGLSDEDTQQQAQEALDFIGDRSPATFGGDFNAEPGDSEVETIKAAGFLDPFVELGIDPAPNTSPAPQPDHRIDFVFVRDAQSVAAEVPDSQASDHRMVVVEIELQP